MKWMAISVKSTKELLRNRMALLFSLLFPVLFVAIFGAAFGQFTGGHTTYEIAVINLDEGIEVNGTLVNHGDNYISVLEELRYQDDDGRNTSRVFSVRTDLTAGKAQRMVEDRNLAGYVVIPANFSQAVTADSMRFVYASMVDGLQEELYGEVNVAGAGSGAGAGDDAGDGADDGADDGAGAGVGAEAGTDGGTGSGPVNYSDPEYYEPIMSAMLVVALRNSTEIADGIPDYNRNATAEVIISGDPARASFLVVSRILEEILRVYIDEVGKATLEEVAPYLPFPVDPDSRESSVVFQNEVVNAAAYSPFDYQVPGIIMFGLLLTSITVAIFMAKEKSKGTLNRLKLTEMSSFDLLLGTTIPFTVLAFIQFIILLGVSLLVGYNFNEDVNLLLVAFIGFWACLATVALGLIIASLVKDEDQAGTLGPAIVVPLSFVTSAFFPLPRVRVVDDFLGTGRPFYITDWLPWTQCSTALAKVLTFGAGTGDVYFELGMMMSTTLILFAIGVGLYHTRRLKAQ